MDNTALSPNGRLAFPHDLNLSRSPSRSPSRRQHFTNHEINPLLANLSPTSTLEALLATDAISTGSQSRKSFIQDSVASASPSDRAWGIKAALAGKKIREWYGELQVWPWPTLKDGGRNGFELSYQAEGPGVNEEQGHTGQFGNTPSRAEQSEVGYSGSIGADAADLYQNRIESIKDDMETLGVEDLKNYVRSTYLNAESRRAPDHELHPDHVEYERMEDFTAIVTATIVQALPTLSRLNTLLSLWSVRLVIIRQAPSFRRNLESCQDSMLSAWMAVGEPDMSSMRQKSTFSREACSEMRAVLQDQISHLGRRLDTMLDLLEGSEDVLPETWVDSMDNLEEEYGSWVVNAEELVLSNEMNLENDHENDVGTRGGNSTGLEDSIIQRVYAPSSTGSGDMELVPNIDGATEQTIRQIDNGTIGGNDAKERPGKDEGIVGVQLDMSGTGVKVDPSTHAQNLSQETTQSSHTHPQLKAAGNGLIESQVKEAATFGSLSATSIGNSNESLESAPGQLSKFDALDQDIAKDDSQSRSAHRPKPFELENTVSAVDSTASSNSESNTSRSGSVTSDYFSNRSSPEIQNATVAEYLGSPVEVTSPGRSNRKSMSFPSPVSRPANGLTEKADTRFSWNGGPSGLISPTSQRSRASTFVKTSRIAEESGSSSDDMYALSHVRTRSASVKSFEVIPRSEVRKLLVRRSESYSPSPIPFFSSGETPSQHSQVSSPLQRSEENNGLWVSVEERSALQDIGKDPRHASASTRIKAEEPTEPEGQDPGGAKPDLPEKSRNRFEDVSDLGPGSTPVTIRRQQPGATANSTTTPKRSMGERSSKEVDQLEARISSILTDIPVDIRLTSGPGSATPESQRSANPSPRTPASRFSASRLLKTRKSTPPPSMTLAPAPQTEIKPRSQNGEPEIKLYHLHQSGKEIPIKLYVRLVGESGERVMVRIGGGWADLGEYLKEYANHHGKRSVSDSRFEIQGLPPSSPLTNPDSPSSRPASPALSSRPSPAAALRKAPQHTPSASDPPRTPASERPSSRGSCAGGDEESPSLGLAGPRTKKVDISPSKQAWVDDMLEQAKSASGETTKKKKGGEMGDLGKVGGVKRVFLKGKKDG